MQNFFDAIETDADALASFEPAAMQRLIHRCAELHMNHIATSGDPFETGSARPLDFGHWAAHKLEQVSEYRLRHGEAVAIGIALDCIYARDCDHLDAAACDRILRLLERLGFSLWSQDLLHETEDGPTSGLGRSRGIPRAPWRATHDHSPARPSAKASRCMK